MRREEVTCDDCGGNGSVEFDKPVVDWENGGYIDGYAGTCPTCDGNGFLHQDFFDQLDSLLSKWYGQNWHYELDPEDGGHHLSLTVWKGTEQ